jgi:CRISPR-associated protein Csx17
MTLHLVALGGCRPAPLAHYLKAIGVLRLVASQVDQGARGAWRDGRFVLGSTLDETSLQDFFLTRYAPTPVLSPWNGGSGFYPKDNTEGIVPIETGGADRFAPYRSAIVAARHVAKGHDKRPDAGPEKNSMMAAVLATWSDDALAWFSSSVFLDDTGEPSYPALLGTGGNDGRLDFSSNYMRRLVGLFDPQTGTPSSEARALLPNALFGEPAPGLPGGPIGQFNPGAAGGANSGSGFDGSPKWNPWDFVFMLEGALVLRVAGLRKLESNTRVQAAPPFALPAVARGFGSAADAEDAGRGEQWLPLWPKLASFDEVRQLFAEARLRTGAGSAEGALDAARALGNLGVARGVNAFVRYNYLVRNGLSNLAVPTGTFHVRHCPEVRLLDEIDDFATRIRRASDRSSAFARLSRSIDEAMLECAEQPELKERWQNLVIALGEAEHAMLSRPKLVVDAFLRPLPELSPDWVARIDDGSPEVQLALAIATTGDPKQGPVHRHALPLVREKGRWNLAKGSESLLHDSDVVWTQRDLTRDLLSIVERRILGSTGGLLPLSSAMPASLEGVAAFLEGSVDEARVGQLARGLMTLTPGGRPHVASSRRDVPVALAVVRLVYPSHKVEHIDQHGPWSPLRLLGAGQWETASAALFRHLAARGVRSKLRLLAGSPRFAQRLAASVAIPISAASHRRLWDLVTKHEKTSHQESDPS